MFKRLKKGKSKIYHIKLLNNIWIQVPSKKIKRNIIVELPRITPKKCNLTFNKFSLNRLNSKAKKSFELFSCYSQQPSLKRKRIKKKRTKQPEIIVIDSD